MIQRFHHTPASLVDPWETSAIPKRPAHRMLVLFETWQRGRKLAKIAQKTGELSHKAHLAGLTISHREDTTSFDRDVAAATVRLSDQHGTVTIHADSRDRPDYTVTVGSTVYHHPPEDRTLPVDPEITDTINAVHKRLKGTVRLAQ